MTIDHRTTDLREIARAWDRHATALAAWSMRRLVNRTDAHGRYKDPTDRRDSDDTGSTAKVGVTLGTLSKHFAGKRIGDLVGLHSTARVDIEQDGGELVPTCLSKWGAIDIDRHGDEGDPDVNERYALSICEEIRGIGFRPLLLDSNGRGGYHLMTLFDKPISTANVYHFHQYAIRGWEAHGLREKPETYPKQREIPEGGFGNWLRLPGRHHTHPHWTRVHDGQLWLEADRAIRYILHTQGDFAGAMPAKWIKPPKPRESKAKPTRKELSLADDAKLADEALRFYPNTDLHYDDWIKIGMCLTPLGMIGMAIWIEWSKGSSKYDEGSCERKWDSFRRNGSGGLALGTLFKIAQDRGFQFPRTVKPPPLCERPKLGVVSNDDEPDDDGPPPDKPGEKEPGEAQPNEAHDDPHRLARIYLVHRGVHADGPTVRFWSGEWWRWVNGCYRAIPIDEVKAEMNGVIKSEFDRINLDEIASSEGESRRGGPPKSRRVTSAVVNNSTGALASYTLLPAVIPQPSWLETAPGDWPPAEVLATRNALVHLPTLATSPDNAVRPPTPRFFSPHCLGFDFDLNAEEPKEWLKFLSQIWPDDPESIDALQEWAGYLLTSDTSQQKTLMLIGPKRSGKGTIARVLTGLLGEDNVVTPTMGSLASEFGLAPLLGKLAAFITDARLSGRMDAVAIAERLLSISGEDGQTINRKHMAQITTRLTTRFVIMSNELPRMNDSSGALVSRMVILEMTNSFHGQEDTKLIGRLMKELPGILLWAILGWQRLRDRGKFLQPASGGELVTQLEDIASPILAFVRDRCTTDDGKEEGTDALFEGWKTYCLDKGRKEHGDEARFGRDLKAACPKVRRSNPVHRNGKRTRVYLGIELA